MKLASGAAVYLEMLLNSRAGYQWGCIVLASQLFHQLQGQHLKRLLPPLSSKKGDVPLNVENCGSGLASFDDYAAFDVSSSPKWLA